MRRHTLYTKIAAVILSLVMIVTAMPETQIFAGTRVSSGHTRQISGSKLTASTTHGTGNIPTTYTPWFYAAMPYGGMPEANSDNDDYIFTLANITGYGLMQDGKEIAKKDIEAYYPFLDDNPDKQWWSARTQFQGLKVSSLYLIPPLSPRATLYIPPIIHEFSSYSSSRAGKQAVVYSDGDVMSLYNIEGIWNVSDDSKIVDQTYADICVYSGSDIVNNIVEMKNEWTNITGEQGLTKFKDTYAKRGVFYDYLIGTGSGDANVWGGTGKDADLYKRQINWDNLASVYDLIDQWVVEKQSAANDVISYIMNVPENSDGTYGDSVGIEDKIQAFISTGYETAVGSLKATLTYQTGAYTKEKVSQQVTADMPLTYLTYDKVDKSINTHYVTRYVFDAACKLAGLEYPQNEYNLHYLDMLICFYATVKAKGGSSAAFWKNAIYTYTHPDEFNWDTAGAHIAITNGVVCYATVSEDNPNTWRTIYVGSNDLTLKGYNLERAASDTVYPNATDKGSVSKLSIGFFKQRKKGDSHTTSDVTVRTQTLGWKGSGDSQLDESDFVSAQGDEATYDSKKSKYKETSAPPVDYDESGIFYSYYTRLKSAIENSDGAESYSKTGKDSAGTWYSSGVTNRVFYRLYTVDATGAPKFKKISQSDFAQASHGIISVIRTAIDQGWTEHCLDKEMYCAIHICAYQWHDYDPTPVDIQAHADLYGTSLVNEEDTANPVNFSHEIFVEVTDNEQYHNDNPHTILATVDGTKVSFSDTIASNIFRYAGASGSDDDETVKAEAIEQWKTLCDSYEDIKTDAEKIGKTGAADISYKITLLAQLKPHETGDVTVKPKQLENAVKLNRTTAVQDAKADNTVAIGTNTDEWTTIYTTSSQKLNSAEDLYNFITNEETQENCLLRELMNVNINSTVSALSNSEVHFAYKAIVEIDVVTKNDEDLVFHTDKNLSEYKNGTWKQEGPVKLETNVVDVTYNVKELSSIDGSMKTVDIVLVDSNSYAELDRETIEFEGNVAVNEKKKTLTVTYDKSRLTIPEGYTLDSNTEKVDLTKNPAYTTATYLPEINESKHRYTVTAGTQDLNPQLITLYYTASSSNPYHYTAEYYSVPEAYAELKEGSVYNELFEAMAGVPSTRTLYFGTGGSEFIVHLYAESERDTAVRTYESRYNSTDCVYKISDALSGGSGQQKKSFTFHDTDTSSGTTKTKESTKKNAEIYDMTTPQGASSYNITISDHKKTSSEITAKWTGIINNTTPDPTILDGQANSGYWTADEHATVAPNGDNWDHGAEATGQPGRMMQTQDGQNYSWDVSNYNKALEQAIQWANEMQDISNGDGNVIKVADSDKFTRSFHVGDATITIRLNGVNATPANEHITVYPKGTWSDGTTTTDSYTPWLLETNDARLGVGYREYFGTGATWSYGGCITSHATWKQYQAAPTNTMSYISSYTVSRGVNSATGTPNNATGSYKDALCGTTSYTKTDATFSFSPCTTTVHTHSSGCYGCTCTDVGSLTCSDDSDDHVHTDSCYQQCTCGGHQLICTTPEHQHTTGCGTVNQTPGSFSAHVCTHSCSFSPLVKSHTVRMQDVSYTIEVRFNHSYTDGDNKVNVGVAKLPAHALCGPCCEHVLPQIHDTWTQEVSYMTVKITNLRVWRLEKGYVEGMSEITGDENQDIIDATINRLPCIWYNIADAPTSAAGRIRYSLQRGQDDAVIWIEKPYNDMTAELHRTNICDGTARTSSSYNPTPSGGHGHEEEWGYGCLYSNDSYGKTVDIHKQDLGTQTGIHANGSDEKDRLTDEWQRFNARRNSEVEVNVISDFLVLEPSSGDECIVYHSNKEVVTAQKPTKTLDEKGGTTWSKLWSGNPYVKSSTKLTVGSYNGRYNLPDTKYEGYGSDGEFRTDFDGTTFEYYTAKCPGNASSNTTLKLRYVAGGYTSNGDIDYYRSYNGSGIHAGDELNRSEVTEKGISSPIGYIEGAIASPSMDGSHWTRHYNEKYSARIVTENIKQKETNPNKEYITGQSYAFYDLAIDYNGDSLTRYQNKYDSILKKNGYTMKSIYAFGKSKINNIVVHDPVSVDGAMILSSVTHNSKGLYPSTGESSSIVLKFDKDTDQRVTESAAALFNDNLNSLGTCPGNPAECEYRILDCNYLKDVVKAIFDFKQLSSYADDELGETVYYATDQTHGLGYDISDGGFIPSSEGIKGNAESSLEIPWSRIGFDYTASGEKASVNLTLKIAGGAKTAIFATDYMTVFAGADNYLYIETAEGHSLKSASVLPVSKSFNLNIVLSIDNLNAYAVKVNNSTVSMTDTVTYIYTDDNCVDCHGTGYVTGHAECLACGATGQILVNTECPVCYGQKQVKSSVKCPDCNGEGKILSGNSLSAGQVKEFSYTGNIQSITLTPGTYKLEVYGAQGGSGGYGGYSAGLYTVNTSTTLYVVVGGSGSSSGSGGYNGGGYGRCSGGGATHIATASGLLSQLSNQKNSILLVGGGGGGYGGRGSGGYGGGANMSGGAGGSGFGSMGYGGTLSSGGSGGGGAGSFGQGGSGSHGGYTNNGYAGGGGGYYGGGGACGDYPNYNDYDDAGAGGGSGYANTSLLTSITGSNGSRSGHGFARITAVTVVPAYQTCATCHGNKTINSYTNCTNCSATGKVKTSANCPTCAATGLVDTSVKCTACSGAGKNKTAHNLPAVPGYILGDTLYIGSGNTTMSSTGLTVTDLTITRLAGSTEHNASCYDRNGNLICTEPHHYGMHYSYDNMICYKACCNDENHRTAATSIKTVDNRTVSLSNFILLDNYFQVYFPNVGDFYESADHGIYNTEQTRGIGYIDRMDTTEWTREKWIRFPYSVLYYKRSKGLWEQHEANTWIQLDKTEMYFDFYCQLKNSEMSCANVEYAVEAINCAPYVEDTAYNQDCPSTNDWITNRYRFWDLTAYHSAYKYTAIDVVGHIGNLVVEDTEDLRFTNLFKKPVEEDKWYIQGILKKVDPNISISFLTWLNHPDLRERSIAKETEWLNTYGTQKWMKGLTPHDIPVSGDKNTVTAMRNENLKLGYDILWDISSIGSYSLGTLQVKPYFYALDTQTGAIIPLDVYQENNGDIEPINYFGMLDETAAKQEELRKSLKNYHLYVDWISDSLRRNYTVEEKYVTDLVSKMRATTLYDASGEPVLQRIPGSSGTAKIISDVKEITCTTCSGTGNTGSTDAYVMCPDCDGRGVKEQIIYENVTIAAPTEDVYVPVTRNLTIPTTRKEGIGTLQLIRATENARTFIGSSKVTALGTAINGSYNTELTGSNTVNIIGDNTDTTVAYGEQGQRWHLTIGLPSNSIFVPFRNGIGSEHVDPYTIITDINGKKIYAKDEITANDSRYAVIMAADITLFGDVFTLKYDKPKASFTAGGKTWTLDDIPGVVVGIAQGSSIEDLIIKQTH